jgi:regulator of sigma E protease
LYYLLIILSIGLLITVHELGHLIAALRSGIPVERFSVGFGPRLFGISRGGVDYCVSLIPLGGYVLPAVRDEEEFFAIPPGKRIVFALGGPLANLVYGIALLALANAIKAGPSFYGIFVLPIKQVAYLTVAIVGAIPQIFTHPGQLSGIVGVVAQGGDIIQSGLASLVLFTAFLSINFTIFNFLPLPVLDGGQILLTMLEKINPGLIKIRIPLAITGWLVMIALMLYVTTQDIIRITSA